MSEKVINERIALWDNMKFFLIITVVCGHLADVITANSNVARSVYLFIYAFHMPLFIYISGMFHRDTNVIKKVLFYFSVELFIKIVDILICFLEGTIPNVSLLSDSWISWYMFALAAFSGITYIIRNQNKKFILIISVILACIAGYDRNISDYLCLSRIIVFFPFYLAGNLSDAKWWLYCKKSKGIKLCALVILLGWVYCTVNELDFFYNFRHLFTGRNPFNDFVRPYGILARAFCYLISLLTGASLIVLTPQRKIKWITDCGKKTIDVYVWHWFVYIVVQRAFHIDSVCSTILGKLIFFSFSLLIPLLICALPIFRFPVNVIMLQISPSDTQQLTPFDTRLLISVSAAA